MGAELRHALLGLLKDEDAAIRRLGVEVLAGDRSPEVLDALRDLAADPSARVRQTVEQVLAGEPLTEAAPAGVT
jgi:HEAT repeat protein